MRAIETPYGGCRFRSRTEARWAVFFDHLGIEWRYECEGYILSPFGECYLPDFFLPELDCWIEVKGPYPTEDEQRKVGLFNYSLVFDDDPAVSRQRSYVLYGDIPWPYPKRGNIIGYSVAQGLGKDPDSEDVWGGTGGLCWQQCLICDRIGIGRINEVFCGSCLASVSDTLENKISNLGCWLGAEELAQNVLNLEFFKTGHKSFVLQKAYTVARSARFEGRHHASG